MTTNSSHGHHAAQNRHAGAERAYRKDPRGTASARIVPINRSAADVLFSSRPSRTPLQSTNQAGSGTRRPAPVRDGRGPRIGRRGRRAAAKTLGIRRSLCRLRPARTMLRVHPPVPDFEPCATPATTCCATIPPTPTATACATSAAAPCWSMEAERQAKESALQEKDASLAEIARLKSLLRSEHPQGDN